MKGAGKLMNTDRRIIQALGPSILLVVAFAACGSDDSTTKPKATGTTGTTSTTGTGTTGTGTGSGTTAAGSTTAGSSTTGTTAAGTTTTGSTGAGGATGSTGSTNTTGGTPTTTAGTGGSTGAGGSTGTGGSGTGTGMACGNPSIVVANAVVSTFDGMSEPLASSAVSPGGLWSGEKGGTSTVTLAAADSGDATQAKAAHLTGMTGSNANTDYADMSTSFSGTAVGGKPSGVDASAYTGISFKIKGGAANMASSIMVKMQNDDSIPACGSCVDGMAGKECYAGYTKTVAVTTSWATQQFPFAQMMPTSWGNHTHTAIDGSGLISMSIVVLPAVSAYDLWIDDVQFYH
jgi:hypothetical protein